MDEVEKWQQRIKLKRFSLIAIIVCVILITLIVLFTVYGSNVGNFVVRIDQNQQSVLSLFGTDDKEDPQELLLAEGLDNMLDTSYTSIQSQIASASSTAGSHNDSRKRFFAYTFYVQNTSSRVVNYNISLNITAVTKNIDSAMRVLVLSGNEQTIYAMRNSNGQSETCGQYGEIKTVPFESSTQVFSKDIDAFASDDITKYTVAMWLEGWDEDCVDAKKGGTIKMELNIEAVQ